MSTQPAPTNNSGLSLLRAIPQRLAELLKKHFQERLRINKSPRLHSGATTDENEAARQGLATELAKLAETTLASIVGLRQEASKWATAAESDVNRRMGRPAPADTNEALLREMREQRAWARVRPLLDQVEPSALNDAVAGHALQALANGDDDTLFALRAELPAYAQAKGASELLPVILTAIDDTMGKARPEILTALTERRELARGMKRLQTIFGHAEFAVSQGELVADVPAWDPKDPDHIVKSDPVG